VLIAPTSGYPAKAGMHLPCYSIPVDRIELAQTTS
jgi:hypothetical protein